MERGKPEPGEPIAWSALAALALGAVALQLGFDLALGLGASGLGHVPPWSEGADELLLHGSAIDIALSCLDLVVLAPFGEELLFRGLMFGLLSRWTSEQPASLVSGAVFSAYHGYGWVGFVSVAFSGYLWARLFARTGSLLPGMLAHGALNLIFCVGVLAYRA